MTEMFDCRGRVALVTGASRGLGYQAALVLAEAGALVILNGRDEAALKRAETDIRQAGGLAETVGGDLNWEATKVVERTVALNGGLDVLVHAAAIRDRRPTAELTKAAFGDLVEANLSAAYDLARAALPHLAQSKAGRLIFITSIAARIARSGDPAYVAAKGGLEALTRALAVEFGSDGLTVNAIAPGFFATEANACLADDPAIRTFIDMRVPLQRWGQPPEIGSAVLFLASPTSGYVNGSTVTVDGGISAQM
jgi:gluconate 5-dehydrogenase